MAARVRIKTFGLQNGTDRTLFVSWTWSKKYTDHYTVRWYYETGNGVWFVGQDNDEKYKQSTYNAPSNAKSVKVQILPVSKTKKVGNGNKEKKYWSASWSTAKVYKFKDTFFLDAPSAPSITIENLRMTVRIDNANTLATHAQFEIISNEKRIQTTGLLSISNRSSVFSRNINAGAKYRARCRLYSKTKRVYSDWSEYSTNVDTIPASPGFITSIKALSKTSIYLSWRSAVGAESYIVQYTDKVDYFDSSNSVNSITIEKTTILATHAEVTGLETGKEYFFRVCSSNSQGKSSWTPIKSLILGKKPAAPTTWSSTTTAMVGEPLTLYWVHNSQDNSSQTYAELEITIDNQNPVVHNIKNTEDEDEKDKTSKYIVDTSTYKEGAVIKWRVRTSGITKEFGDWSILRTVDIYAPPTLTVQLIGTDEQEVGIIESYPFKITALAGPNTQKPVSYYISVVSNSVYETTDYIGNQTIINEGDVVYEKYLDTQSAISLTLSAGDIDLENNKEYTLSCVVSMDSGLTAEDSKTFSVAWTEQSYSPNAEITFDFDTYTATIYPYCYEYIDAFYKVTNEENNFIPTTEKITDITPIKTTTNEDVFLYRSQNGNIGYYCIVESSDSGDTICTFYSVTKSDETYTKTSSVLKTITDVYLFDDSEQVLVGKDSSGVSIFYYRVEEPDKLISDLTLSVYRREFDGTFTEIATGLNNEAAIATTDPHPALDYVRYRIVAISKTTGAVSFYDLPAEPIDCSSIIIQWDEHWSNFDNGNENAVETPPWSGSLLKLPYNIDVSNSNDNDVEFVEYVGRNHPVSYYGTQRGEKATWNTDVPKDDEETLYALRRLAIWMGDCYVREPSGSGYWANISVSFNQKHDKLTIPVTLDITRVDGGK